MENIPSGEMTASVTRFQSAIGLLLIGVCCGTFLAVDLLANNEAIEDWFRDRELEFRERSNLVFPNRGYFVDFEDRLLMDELPRADYSQGGVYFFGSSNLKWGLMLWELPPERRRLVHSYAIGSTNHTFQFQFIRYLAERKGWLEAGGEKTRVILAVCYRSGVEKGDFFPKLWTRHGLYDYDPGSGISDSQMTPMAKWYTIERERCSGFLRVLGQEVERSRHRSAVLRRTHDHRAYRKRLVAAIEATDWRETMDREVAELGRLIDYLRDRRVGVTVVLLPRIGWTNELPYPAYYKKGVTEVCESRSVDLHDLSDLLPDEVFVDSSHVNLAGLQKQHAALMSIATEQVRQIKGDEP